MLTELWSELRYRLRALFGRAALERELDAELHFHLEQEAMKYVAAGMPMDAALRRARLAFGGVERIKEESRDVRGTRLLETTLRDLRYAARSLRRSPGFTLTAVLCLALGIGATSTVFGIVDALFFRPPPGVGDPGGIVRPYVTVKAARLSMAASGQVSYPAYVELRDHTRSLDGLAGYADITVSVGLGAQARRADGLAVTGNYFSVLRVRPALGRFFAPEEDAGPGSPPVVVVSHAFWRSELGGDSAALGARLVLDGHPFTIVGVAPKDFRGVDMGAPALWVPISQAGRVGLASDQLELPTSWWLTLFGRLAPGVTREQARAELAPLITRRLRADFGADVDPHIDLGPILSARGPSPSTQAKIARWLALAAALVLAIACANTANLLLARAVTRRKEIGIRLSMGASRLRVVRQLLTESLLLAVCATALGLLLAFWGTDLVPAVGLPSLSFFARGRMLVFAVAATVVCVLLFGLAPALAATRADLASTVKEGAREGTDRRSRLRSTLMVVQVALATVLLVGAGLFVHSLRNVQAIEPGIDVDHLLVASVDLGRTGYSGPAAAQFLQRAVERVRHVPGVRGVTLSSQIPLAGGFSITAYSVPDGTSGVPANTLDLQQAMAGTRAITLTVGPHYFATVGTPVLAGREFTEQDRADTEPVVVVNQAFAEHEWPGASAIGRCVDIGWRDNVKCHRVVGVVANAKYVNLEERPRPAFFEAAAQDPGADVLLIRTAGDPAALAASVRQAVAELDPRLPYVEVKMLRDVLRPTLQPRRLGASMFGAFGLLALVLAAVGLYGVVSYGVEERRHELGVRLALGAQPGQVRRLVVWQGMMLTLTGLAIGTAGALALSRLVTHLLYGVTPTDPITFAGVCAMFAAVAALASLIPAGRAARVDPIVALRTE